MRTRSLLVAALITLAGAAAATPPAHATPAHATPANPVQANAVQAPGPPVLLRNVQSGLCLQSDGSQLFTAACHGGLTQQWRHDYRDTNLLTLIHHATGLCVEGLSPPWYHVGLYQCVGGFPAQVWVEQPGPSATRTYTNWMAGRCLDGYRISAINLWPCGSSTSQRWQAFLA